MSFRNAMPVAWLGFVCAVCVGYLPAAETPDEVPFVDGQPLPAARPNEGWTLVRRPAVHRTVTEQVEISPASSYLETIPAKWETRNETIQVSPETKVLSVVPAKHETETFRVMTRPEFTRLEVIPARYETATEEVVIEAAREETRTIPAQYRTETERIQVAPSYTYWKKVSGHGLESYCLCEVPAKFVMVTKQVLDKEATTETVTIPARTKLISVQRLVADADVRKVVVPAEFATMERGFSGKSDIAITSIPAKFETISKQVLLEPESTRKIEIPAKFETQTRVVLDRPETKVWRRIRCDCGDIVKKYKEIPGTDEASLLMLKRK